MTEQIDYGYEPLLEIPPEMAPWNLRLDLPNPSDFGQYVLVGCEQAGVELHHQVEVIDENGDALQDVWVIFGFPGGGPEINLAPSRNYWPGGPVVLRGNAQKTTLTGYVQHTFASGGEDIWVWDLDKEDALKLPSPLVRNCTWVGTPIGKFEHTGVKLTFQRRMTGVIPQKARLEALEQKVKALEIRVASLEDVERRLSELEAKVRT